MLHQQKQSVRDRQTTHKVIPMWHFASLAPQKWYQLGLIMMSQLFMIYDVTRCSFKHSCLYQDRYLERVDFELQLMDLPLMTSCQFLNVRLVPSDFCLVLFCQLLYLCLVFLPLCTQPWFHFQSDVRYIPQICCVNTQRLIFKHRQLVFQVADFFLKPFHLCRMLRYHVLHLLFILTSHGNDLTTGCAAIFIQHLQNQTNWVCWDDYYYIHV